MKIKTFNYQDLKGRESVRTCLILSEPQDKIMAIDISELDEVSQANFAVEYKALHNKFLESVKALENSYELYYRLRQFFPDQMMELENIEV